MKRPLVIPALLYAGGILVADVFPFPLVPLFALALALAILSLAWARARPWLLIPLLLLVGMANLTRETVVLSPWDLRSVVQQPYADVALRGRLVETPVQRVYLQDEEEFWRVQAEVNVEAVRFGKEPWQPASGRVAATTPGVLRREFFGGQRVEVEGILQEPHGPFAPGLFDYRTYLRRHGVYFQLRVSSTEDWKLLSPAGPLPLTDRFTAWARANLARGLPEEDEALRLLWAMTLGWRTALTGEVSEPFMRSGTMHIFAISGLHVALIAGIMIFLLRVMGVPRAACGVVAIPLLWFYTAATGWQPSAICSTVMMTVIIAGWALKRPSDLLNSLAAAALLLLFWEPQQLFQASFQLSFFVVLSLGLFAPVLEKIRNRLLQPAPLLPADLRPRWRMMLERGIGYASSGLVTSLAAWLGSLPLVAYYFHLFTPVSLLANLLIVPLSGLALMSALASLLTGGWFPALAEMFNHSAWFWMSCMVNLSHWFARLPAGHFYVGPPQFVTFILYYAVLISVMAGWLRKPRWRLWVIAAWCGLTILWLGERRSSASAIRLTILPLNGGEALFLDAPGRDKDWLLDCGSEASADRVTKQFLRAQGLNRVPRLLLTHGDLQNVGGAGLLLKEFSIREVYLSPVRFRSTAYRQFHDFVSQQPGLLRTIQRGDEAGPWQVLYPGTQNHFAVADDNAIVLRGQFHGYSVLLLSDLGKPGQNALMAAGRELRADIVVSGLPQQSEPLADALIDAIQPRLIIITDSQQPAGARASPKLRERLSRRGIPILYTREIGSVTLAFHRDGWSAQAVNGTRITHRAGEVSFAPDVSPAPPHIEPGE